MKSTPNYSSTSLLTLSLGFLLALPCGAMHGGDEPAGRLRWSVADEGEWWVPNGVALGDSGASAIAGLRNNAPQLALFPAGSAEPVFQQSSGNGLYLMHHKVSMAESAPFAVSMQSLATGNVSGVVYGHDTTGDGAPLWTYDLPASEYNFVPGLLTSRDGEVTLVWWSTDQAQGVFVTALARDGAVISRGVLPTDSTLGTTGVQNVQLSDDGALAMFVMKIEAALVVYDVARGEIDTQLPLSQGLFNGNAMSGDGGRIAVGVYERLRVYERVQAGSYALVANLDHQSSLTVTEVALDQDGSRVGYFLEPDSGTDLVRVVLHDLEQDVALVDHSYAAPGTVHQLHGVGIELDDAGETLAGVNWGDDFGATPEVFCFDAQGNALVELHARGSGLYLDLSADGSLLFAGCKASHANSFGPGGDLYMIETRAQRLRVEGAPRLGAELSVVVDAEPEYERAVLAVATGLLDAPDEDGLWLDPAADLRIVGSFPLEGGGLTTEFALPDDASLAGTLVHFQVLLLNPLGGHRRASNAVAVRLLP